MQIVHASIPADHPRHVAEVLAQIMEGEAMPFPPGGPDSWMAWADDASIELEIVQRGYLLHRDEKEAAWHPGAPVSRHSEVHLAIGVKQPASAILAWSERAGWPARLCSRGNGLFELVEVWIEGSFLIEMFDPDQMSCFREVVTPASWKAMLAQDAGR